jgi:tetratricopeptide (TPR) repeat protein
VNIIVKAIQYIFISISICCATIGCSKKDDIQTFKTTLNQLLSEFEAIEDIPMNVEHTVKNSGAVQGEIDLSKRIGHYESRKEELEKILESFDELIYSSHIEPYYDDVLFCKAYGLLYLSNLDQKGPFIDDTLQAIDSFVDMNGDTRIEEWTKNKLKKVFWDKLSMNFSNKISEKENLKQFFFLSSASIYQYRKQDTERALDYYNKVIHVQPNSLFAQQAAAQIKQIMRR